MTAFLSRLVLVLAFFATPAVAQRPPAEWDGLVRVQSRHFDSAYLAPGADFRPYTKVMIDPTDVAFRRNWQRDYNQTVRGLQDRIDDREARDILNAVQSGFQEVFAQAYRDAGFEIVTEPGPDVMRIRTGIANLDVQAPDQMNPGRSTTFSEDAGQATLILEVRDSMSGAILGRGVDNREVGDSMMMMSRSRVSNRADFERMFRSWGEWSAQALIQLRQTETPQVG